MNEATTMNKLWRAVSATMVFVAMLLLVYGVHARFFHVDVVLYDALLDGVLACILSAAVLWRGRWLAMLGGFEKLQLAAIWLLLAYGFAISVPTVIDRSLSFYILEKLQQRGGGIQLARLDEVFVREYMPEHRLVEIRLTEQLASGTVRLDGNCVRLTQRGQHLASFSRYLRRNFLPRQRLLMSDYSDALTDPFRHDRPSPGYEC
ncbi:conserved membrane protein of unknown function [Sterolibacterium denitrificans]|uniref:Uncharacterized protein n=2 Tax=Sterolibacterium denitrificans TaxID=157592 RepID=A0A7Z7MUG2_9PROT|nr:conserved membrane protein of unknown function [Sterolibacterium denitrificans]